MIDLREKLWEELGRKILDTVEKEPKIKKLFKITSPKNGPTIKLNGVVLYKILKISNPWGNGGIAIHKHILPHALERIGGKLEKNGKWAGCALNTHNYEDIKNIVMELIEKVVFSKLHLGTAKTIAVPKKKKTFL